MEVEVWRMSPERVLPEPEDDQQQPPPPQELGPVPVPVLGPGPGPGPAHWSSEEEEEDEEESGGGPEAPAPGGYQYLPLSQEPGPGGAAEPDIGERLQELRLYLPEAPADSDEEDVEATPSSRQSIPMDPEHVELVKRTMAAIKIPSLGVPSWAQEISDEQWQSVVQQTIETKRSTVAVKDVGQQ
ncbi:male-enhanced antigen 1 [Hemiscyllium ocellatum]|uniref:male-enhanced antigen 1 n=1 Tax=Hemiscyllium ocellatum TaxID=170820 RepID=UPI0029663C6F|nr:male-enhanced antigen 1 [Hemiscyllium ocellatum]XP_060704041.1 male-enhanced antigen 1 [Hemiscyllium ocellatum]